jgi:hypothetical protein
MRCSRAQRAANKTFGYTACPKCGGRMDNRSKQCLTCQEAEYASPDRPIPMSPSEQAVYGAIVTLENAGGEIVVIHHTGRIKAAVERAYVEATSLDASFRIVSVSTPTSIFEDMQGARASVDGSFSKRALLPEAKYGAMVHERMRR